MACAGLPYPVLGFLVLCCSDVGELVACIPAGNQQAATFVAAINACHSQRNEMCGDAATHFQARLGCMLCGSSACCDSVTGWHVPSTSCCFELQQQAVQRARNEGHSVCIG
jgi:hypothetical protein